MELNEIKKKLPPDQYRLLLDKIRLSDIYLSTLNTKCLREQFYSSPKKVISISDSYSHEVIRNKNIVSVDFQLEATPEGKKKHVFQIKATYKLEYDVTEDLPEEFWTVYSQLSVPITIFPYFRELVSSITNKMNLPPLTLPLMINKPKMK